MFGCLNFLVMSFSYTAKEMTGFEYSSLFFVVVVFLCVCVIEGSPFGFS